MQSSAEEPFVWEVAQPPRQRRVSGIGTTISVLSIGLAATAGVVWFALSWSVVVGDVLHWARWMLVIVQAGLWLVATTLCAWLWRRGKSGLWIAITAAALATVFFVAATFLIIASLPCPSLC